MREKEIKEREGAGERERGGGRDFLSHTHMAATGVYGEKRVGEREKERMGGRERERERLSLSLTHGCHWCVAGPRLL